MGNEGKGKVEGKRRRERVRWKENAGGKGKRNSVFRERETWEGRKVKGMSRGEKDAGEERERMGKDILGSGGGRARGKEGCQGNIAVGDSRE